MRTEKKIIFIYYSANRDTRVVYTIKLDLLRC